MKECSVCGDPKDLSEFHKDKTKNDGHSSTCKLCKKKYIIENKAQIDEQRRRWREANSDMVAEINRKWREANPEYAKEWRKANPEYAKEWCEANPEYAKEWWKRHKEEMSERRKKSYQDRKAQQQKWTSPDSSGPGYPGAKRSQE